MGGSIDVKQRVGLIKKLQEWGYKEKHIIMITGDNQSYVNRVLNGRLHAATTTENVEIDEKTRKKIMAVDRILDPIDIFSDDPRQDIKYIKVMKLFMVDKDIIYKTYDFLAKARVNRMLNRKDVDLTLFDSTLIGIDREIFLELIVDFV